MEVPFGARPEGGLQRQRRCQSGDVMGKYSYQGNGRFRTLDGSPQGLIPERGYLGFPMLPWAPGFYAVWPFVSWEQVSSRHSVDASDKHLPCL